MSCELDIPSGQFYDTDTNLPCTPDLGGNTYSSPPPVYPNGYPDPTSGNGGGGGVASTIYNPSATINQGGVAINTTPLDKVLSSVLSFFALATHAPYVPTTVQPVKNTTPVYATGVNSQTGIQLSGSQAVGTTTQSIFNWIKANPVPLAGIGIAYFLFTRDPKRR